MRQILSLLIAAAFLTNAANLTIAQDAAEKKEEATKKAEKAPTERELYDSVRAAFTAKKYDEAEKGLADFETRFPNSLRLNGLQYQAYFAYVRIRNYKDSVRHITAVVDRTIKQVEKNPSSAASLSGYTSSMISVMQRAGKADEAAAKLEEVLTAIDKANDGSNPVLSQGYSSLIYTKARTISAKKPDDAFDLVTAEVKKAKTAFDTKSDNQAVLNWYASARYSQMSIAYSASPENFKSIRDSHLEFVTAQASKSDENVAAISAYISAHSFGIATMISEDVDRAEKLLASATEFLDGIETENTRVKSVISNGKRQLSSNSRRIDVAKKHQALIGTDAVALDADGWANGEALSDDDLKGKVVLLDFWAVWCGPCIATFPHLIEWNEKYADKGLVIIGATRYYQRGWNAEANRITSRDPKLAPEAERAAMVQFAEYHKLTHRFMVTPKDSKYHSDYAVSGIPQAVLIGRDGKIRMIKVGSGSANAAALHHEIEKLLAE